MSVFISAGFLEPRTVPTIMQVLNMYLLNEERGNQRGLIILIKYEAEFSHSLMHVHMHIQTFTKWRPYTKEYQGISFLRVETLPSFSQKMTKTDFSKKKITIKH